jgi:Na+/H+-dicarboxylate symporter
MIGAKSRGISGTLWVLLGLVAGLGLGATLGGSAGAALQAIAEPLGGIWLDGLRMTVVPLVFSMLVTGVIEAAASAGQGGMAARALGWFFALMLASAVFSVVVSPLLLDAWPVVGNEAAALIASGKGAEIIPAAPPFAEWLRSFVPTNPVGAAATGAMVPLVVFALVFGLAATRLPDEPRTAITGLFDAIVRTMLVIVGWVLWAAPIGVFGLAVGVGSALGGGAFGLLGHYLALLLTVQGLLILMIYPFAVVMGGVSLPAFARALAPVQLVAIGTQSSIACLPAMVKASQRLGVAEAPRRLVLPLAVSMFKITSPCANIAVVLYLAAVHGIDPGLPQILAGIAVALAVAVASAGLPGGSSFYLACVPIAAAMGVPTQLLPILLAVEVVPDIFRTIGNVTGDVAVTAAVGRQARVAIPAAA